MNVITDSDVIRMMERYGGGFASSLAIACMHADAGNLARIKAAFPELWAQYAEMVKREVKA